MNLPNCDAHQTKKILKLVEQLLPIWQQQAPRQIKYDKKTGLTGVKLSEELTAIPFSILKDNKGQFYFIENDTAVTKAEEAKGAQGKYKRLFPIQVAPDGELSIGEQQVGVKIAMKSRHKKIAKATEKDEMMDSIFGSKSDSSLMSDIFAPLSFQQPKTDEEGALRVMGRHVDTVQLGSKQYILMHHYEGIQLLKFINTQFADYDLKNQVEVFSEMMMSCVNELASLHDRKIAHRDAQFKNFIKANGDNKCHVIDFGSTLQKANRSQMENDFLTLAKEMRVFDQYFNASKLKSGWSQFKDVFKAEVIKDNVSVRDLLGLIETFKNVCFIAELRRKPDTSF